MRISKNTLHSYGILLLLAKESPDTYMKSAEIAERLDLSESSIKKTLRLLVVGEMLESSATKDGGFKLAKSTDDITLADIIKITEGPSLIQCSDDYNLFTKIFGDVAPTDMPPYAHIIIDVIKKSQDAILSALSDVTLSEVLDYCLSCCAQKETSA